MAAPPIAAAGTTGDSVGVPALAACRVKLVWEEDAAAAAEVRPATQLLAHGRQMWFDQQQQHRW